MFEPIPEPTIDLDLDSISVKQLLNHPLIQDIHSAGMPWIKDQPDLVHVYIEGGSIFFDGKYWTSATSVTPIPRDRPDYLLGVNGITCFRGVIEHPWESRKRYRRFHQKYIDANVDAALVEFIHTRIFKHLDTPLDEAKGERLWLLIASAALQCQYPNELWFIPWLASTEVKQAAVHIFGAFDWIEIISRGFDLWMAEKNLVGHLHQRPTQPPAMAGSVAADSPFAF